jgi:hypothetical protein
MLMQGCLLGANQVSQLVVVAGTDGNEAVVFGME